MPASVSAASVAGRKRNERRHAVGDWRLDALVVVALVSTCILIVWDVVRKVRKRE